MRHKPIAELEALADLASPEIQTWNSRDERLRRWIALLLETPRRELRSLQEIEHLSPAQRRECSAETSPLTVAYEDASLRASGLRSDRVGDCTLFFGLTDEQMHDAFCSCHVGAKLTGEQAAGRLQEILSPEASGRTAQRGLWPRLRRLFQAA